MCRLYGFRSSQRRKVECELIAAQNSLLRQSLGDAMGQVHSDGWGLGHYEQDTPRLARQPNAASAGDEFRWASASAFTTNAVAHVRHATVGRRRLDNTHPFQLDQWLFAHNGTLGAFALIKPQLLAAMTPQILARPRGDTDSEHVFHFLLSCMHRHPGEPVIAVVRQAVSDVLAWSREADPRAEVALNFVLTDGRHSVVQRLGRTLWSVQREHVHPCQVCGGAIHVKEPPRADYRAVAFASEPITTDEHWVEAPDGTLFAFDEDLQVTQQSL
jgi:glutamine amidotransferase